MGADAVELPRDPGPTRNVRGRVIRMNPPWQERIGSGHPGTSVGKGGKQTFRKDTCRVFRQAAARMRSASAGRPQQLAALRGLYYVPRGVAMKVVFFTLLAITMESPVLWPQ